MNFQVPQFIEVEDRIFGPLTFKQFAYIAGGAGTIFLIWSLVPIHFIAIIVIAPVAALALALAFYKVNNRPFILVMESAFRYLLSTKLFIWRKKETPRSDLKDAQRSDLGGQRSINIPKLSSSKLKDLAWSLDVKETIR